MPGTKSIELRAFRRGGAVILALRLWCFALAYHLSFGSFVELIKAPFRLGCALLFVLLLAAACRLLGLLLG
jgi:hypothetical protein